MSPHPVEAALDPNAMVLVFDTSLGGSDLNLPFSGGTGVTIDWGDGTTSSQTTHTYSSAGVYTIAVTGSATLLGPYLPHTGYSGITRVESYGNLGLTSLSSAFSGATNLVHLPDLPATITDTSFMLNGASSYNESVNNWDTSNVTSMEAMFAGASSFNNGCAPGVRTCPLDPSGTKWDTSKVTNFVAMFNGDLSSLTPSVFNQRVSNLNLSSATAMHFMFRAAAAFNNGCASGVFTCPMTSTSTTWNPGLVTNFAHMFMDATSFNQSISGMDIHSATDLAKMFLGASAFNNGCALAVTACPMTQTTWNTTNVVVANEMFQGAGAFNQDVSTWDLRSLVIGYRMFQSTSLSRTNYNKLLVRLATLPLQTGASFGAVPTKYSGATAIAAHDTLTASVESGGFAWSIADGGVDTSPTYPSTISGISPSTGTYLIGDEMSVGSSVSETDTGNACGTAGGSAPTYSLAPDPTAGSGGTYTLSAGTVDTTGWNAGTYTMAVSYPGDGTCEPSSDSTTVLTFVTQRPPSAPPSVTGWRGERKVSVSWTSPLSDGGTPIVGYLVEIRSGSGPWSPAKGGCTLRNTSVSTVLTCEATGLDNFSTYTVRVSALNAAGASPPTHSWPIPPRRLK